MRVEHLLPSGLLGRRPVRILVVGAGGTGSAIVMGLPYLHQAMKAWGNVHGLEVTLMDGDTVSETNCVRQPFSWSDIGQNKATVLINRINLFWGTKWNAYPECFDESTLRSNHDRNPDLLIGCVDTRAARGVIERSVTRKSSYVTYWLDLGNNASSGQFVLGQPLNGRNRRKAERLRTVTELYPEITDTAVGEDPLPSCSAIEALERQEPFINQTLAASALAMLARLFRYGRLGHHGGFFNAATGKMTALPADPEVWRRIRKSKKQLTHRSALSPDLPMYDSPRTDRVRWSNGVQGLARFPCSGRQFVITLTSRSITDADHQQGTSDDSSGSQEPTGPSAPYRGRIRGERRPCQDSQGQTHRRIRCSGAEGAQGAPRFGRYTPLDG
jgi:PRTRC genetic system ThiF family protein